MWDLSSKNKIVKTEVSVKPDNHKNSISGKIMRLAPLLFAFAAGVSVAWFSMNTKEYEKDEPAKEAREPVPLEQIVLQDKGSALDSAREYNAQGLLYFGQKNYVQAEYSFEKAVGLCPDYDVALGNLFNAKFVLKKFDEAISLLERLQKVRESGFKTDLLSCYFASAAHLLSQDNPLQAQARLNCFFELNPEAADFYDGVNLYLRIAGYYFAKDDFRNSVRVSERLLEIVPLECKEERAKLHSNLAISYYGLADAEKDANYLRFTEKHIQQARELDPDNEKIKEISDKCVRLFQAIEASKK